MFTRINAVDLAIRAARAPAGEVARDRERYRPFFEKAEQYAAANDLVVGGDGATRLLLRRPPTPDSYYYEFYAARALSAARGLADALHEVDPGGLGRYVVMMARVPGSEFSVAVDERELFYVRALPTHRGVHTFEVLMPSERPGAFVKSLTLRCMGPEIQLIGVYSALSNPAQAARWEELQTEEQELRALFLEEIAAKITETVGDSDEDDAVEGGRAPRRRTEKGTTAALVEAVLGEFVPNSGRVLVGPYASPGGPESDQRDARLQLVTAHPLRDEEAALKKIAARHGANVQASTNSPQVPTDTRIRRLTMYVQRPGRKRESFVDIYNAGDYELVPAVPGEQGGTRIGTVFVQARFLLVDLWTLRLLLQMKAIDASYAERTLRSFVRAYRRLLKRLADIPFAQLFPLDSDSYIGRYEDPVLARKRATFAQSSRGPRTPHPPYYPARHPGRAK